MSVWNKIFDCLTDGGFAVYQPGQHTGECIEPYIVVKHSTQMRHGSFSTDVWFYDILIYVPLGKYGTLEETLLNVKNCLRQLIPLVRETGDATEPYFDESVKAYMVSMTYRNNKLVRGYE